MFTLALALCVGSASAQLRPPIKSGTTPVLLSVESRHVHGSAGTFNLVLSGVASIEPRLGPVHTIVFTFDQAVSAGTARVFEGTATAGPPTFSGVEMIVPLTGVSNIQSVSIVVSNVTTPSGGMGGMGATRIGFLAADVNQSRAVTVADLSLVQAQETHSVTASNYLMDVNANGAITVGDYSIVNSYLATGLSATIAPQVIIFDALSNQPAGGAPFTVAAAASSGLVVAFSSLTTTVCSIPVGTTTVTLLGSGTCTIRAAQSGNATYSAAPTVDQSFSITAAQTLSYTYDLAGNRIGIHVSP